jgi:N-acetylmuramoyl-L-alanine amidase
MLVRIFFCWIVLLVLADYGSAEQSSGNAVLEIESIPSPNFDQRPNRMAVDTIVIHATERNYLEEVLIHFSKRRSKVSSHYTIDRDGRVIKHVNEDKRAWHAGVSRMPDGREKVNDFSIGIELVNLNDGKDPFPKDQTEVLRRLIQEISTRHPIKFIVSHAEVAWPPGRKLDPLGFDFSCLGEIGKKFR